MVCEENEDHSSTCLVSFHALSVWCSYIVDNFLDGMNDIAATGRHDQINSYYFMGVLILEVLLRIVIRDALMAIASFVFVFLYLRLTVGSWFLAIVGMAEIILSVPVSWFLYKVVFRVEYFAFLNVLTLFIVAAIGADDVRTIPLTSSKQLTHIASQIFIFMDAYKLSAHSDDPEVLEDLESRMSWVYRRTGSAMFITSATTCAAFLCTLITPLVDIRSFGIFAAIVIFMDYVPFFARPWSFITTSLSGPVVVLLVPVVVARSTHPQRPPPETP
jgi:hypothetical protein